MSIITFFKPVDGLGISFSFLTSEQIILIYFWKRNLLLNLYYSRLRKQGTSLLKNSVPDKHSLDWRNWQNDMYPWPLQCSGFLKLFKALTFSKYKSKIRNSYKNENILGLSCSYLNASIHNNAATANKHIKIVIGIVTRQKKWFFRWK